MGRAVKGMIVGEIFVTVVGLGGLERRFSSSFDSAGIWAIVVVVVAAAMVLTTAIQGIDRVLNRWAHEA
jgi:ABC-type nitrate/sulfonate/bicarbonate transport system permease component